MLLKLIMNLIRIHPLIRQFHCFTCHLLCCGTIHPKYHGHLTNIRCIRQIHLIIPKFLTIFFSSTHILHPVNIHLNITDNLVK